MSSLILKILILAIGSSLRWRIEDPNRLLMDRHSKPAIFVMWHNRLFLIPYLFWKYWNILQRGKVAVMVSASKDGGYLVRVLERFNLICVRGSSSRRGNAALLEITRLVQDGADAGITPDGPRGPKYKVADGVISLAQLTCAPIVPISYVLSHKIELNSWDGFMIPLPFSRATVRVGAPVAVATTADDEEREHKRLELETILKSLSEL
ncbi:MAG: lysophospholipid acyltransferase family protein [Verrucomicrobiota bacterium]|jgi:lysophospholipid acyltransferase (LPLAT)-like uncharacterized protein